MELEDRVGRFRLLLRDRDPRFTAEGIGVLATPVRAPRADADAERWVGTVVGLLKVVDWWWTAA